MLGCIAILLVCQLVGEAISVAFELPLPGPVIGMAMLVVGLTLRGGVPEPLEDLSRGLLDHLALLFVPAGVGVMLHVSLVADEWLPISTALVLSTVITIAVTALIMRLLLPSGAPPEGLDDRGEPGA